MPSAGDVAGNLIGLAFVNVVALPNCNFALHSGEAKGRADGSSRPGGAWRSGTDGTGRGMLGRTRRRRRSCASRFVEPLCFASHWLARGNSRSKPSDHYTNLPVTKWQP